MIDVKVLASGSKGNCYRITDGSTPLLLECGIKYKDIQIGLNFKTSSLAGCLISHEHKDHCKSLKSIVKNGIDCYMSKGARNALEIRNHRIKIVKPLEQFKLGTWTILPFGTQHDAQEPLGYLMQNEAGEKLLFATDTYYIRYKFQDLTHVMVECNYSLDILQQNVESGIIPASLKNRILKSHFSLSNVKDFLLANDLSKVREIWLLHLSENNGDAKRFKREVQEITGKIVYIA